MTHAVSQDGRQTTLHDFIHQQEHQHPGATGVLSGILSAIELAAKAIAQRVRTGGLEDVFGAHGETNVQGEDQQKLDVFANDVLKRCLSSRSGVAVLGSEEDPELTIVNLEIDGHAYGVFFDPLDGSSNLFPGGVVGTIFSIVRYNPELGMTPEQAILRPGAEQVAAGYILYSSSTVFVLTTGDGVAMFVLDPGLGSFQLVSRNVRIPAKGKVYSVNEGNALKFAQEYRNFLDWAHASNWKLRYVGTMVADIHNILLNGGVFFYPSVEPDQAKGKLRLMYEVNPMAFIIEQAGGLAISYRGSVLAMQPTKLHQRVPCIIGSPDVVGMFLAEFMPA